MDTSISSRKIGVRSILPFSGKIKPESVTEFGVNAYNSVKSVSRCCGKIAQTAPALCLDVGAHFHLDQQPLRGTRDTNLSGYGL